MCKISRGVAQWNVDEENKKRRAYGEMVREGDIRKLQFMYDCCTDDMGTAKAQLKAAIDAIRSLKLPHIDEYGRFTEVK